ncbi:MAG: GlsB/YeaQ/YmgE family stress response membrane protein [Gammaproteobacteria bacterium]|nr:GlsB/YeaQ/YmgE family stress response membrane protein [Gammaproteobacteria bacterium]
MDITGLFVFLIIGAVAGWLAGKILKGKGLGLIGNMLVGIVGAVLGGFLFDVFGITASGLIGSIITATVGAIMLLSIVRIVKKA